MRAIRYQEHGGPNVLELKEISKPKPDDDELLVKVEAAGVNPVDTYFREGIYEPVELPMIPGSDFSGKVESVGKDVTDFRIGDRVFGTGLGKDHQGTYAEYVTVPEDYIAKLPKNVSFEEGAAIALVSVTVWRALIDHADLKPGEKCLIHGGSGGIGHTAVQLASTIGAGVVSTVGTDEARNQVEELGADNVFFYNRRDLDEAVMKATEGGPDVILDHMLEKYLEFDLRVSRFNGRIIGIGESDKEVIVSNTAVGRNKEITLQLMSMFNTPRFTKFGSILGKIATLMEKKMLRPRIAKVYSLEEAREAQRAVIEKSYFGKLVIAL